MGLYLISLLHLHLSAWFRIDLKHVSDSAYKMSYQPRGSSGLVSTAYKMKSVKPYFVFVRSSSYSVLRIGEDSDLPSY